MVSQAGARFPSNHSKKSRSPGASGVRSRSSSALGEEIKRSAFMSSRAAPLRFSVALGGVAATAHQSGVGEFTATAFAVRVDVIDGEIVPREFAPAALAGALIGAAPDDAALFGGETALSVLAGEEAFEEGAEDLLRRLRWWSWSVPARMVRA